MKLITLAALLAIVFHISLYIGGLYVIGSAATSFAKAANGHCGAGKVGLEMIFDGRWFCPVRD